VSGATSKETQTMIKQRTSRTRTRRRLALLSGLFALSALMAPASQAIAAEPQPAWSLQVTSYPTNFPPETPSLRETGPGYTIVANNIGDEYTTGEFTITDELPVGLSVPSDPEMQPVGHYGHEGRQFKLKCNVVVRLITCKGGYLEEDEDNNVIDNSLEPGAVVSLNVHVNVDAPAPAVLLNEVSIEGGGASSVTTTTPTTISPTIADFDFTPGFSGAHSAAVNADGSVATQAGSHPTLMESASMNFTTYSVPKIFSALPSGGGVKDVFADLPRGVIVNPQATPHCTEAELESAAFIGCREDSQIGTVTLTLSLTGQYSVPTIPLYNMVPPAGVPAEFGFNVIEGIYIHIDGEVRTGGDYGLSAQANDILGKVTLAGAKVNLWGDPTSEVHNRQRGKCLNFFSGDEECPPKERLSTPLLTMPSACTSSLTNTLRIDSWAQPNAKIARSYQTTNSNGEAFGIDGCNKLAFRPTFETRGTTNLIDSPSGLDFNLHIPQPQDVEALAEANLKDAKVVLPEGMVVNPSAGDGLGVCTAAQININGSAAATCPDSSKLGTAEVKTPLLEKPLPGAVYLAKPYENPFNSLLAVYLSFADPRTGVVIKLPGEVAPDPNTGRLTTTFKEQPQLPFEELKLSLFGGARGSFTTPPLCATNTTTSVLTPWTTPEGADATPSDSFPTTSVPGGGKCPTKASEVPNRPTFDTGTVAPQAGAFSPLLLKITRADGTQRLTGIDATMPPGLTGKLAGLPYCSEAQIAAAAARSKPQEGALEQASPSCPSASEVGIVNVGAGSGPTPLYVSGRVYWAGPYKGAPLSLAIITPAVAGPFDLGVVVNRTALYVNPETAQIRAVSDPLPTILGGIPLDIRSIALKTTRPDFTLNPTSCDPMKAVGSLTSSLGQSALVSSPFQVGGCSTLGFKPKLSLKLKGGTKRGKNPALTATLTQPPGQANIRKAIVTLPHSAFLDQSHIRTVCTRVQFAEGSVPGEKCPPGSIYGRARATTPLLAEPLSGPVYLRSSSHELPDLVVALHGQVDVVVVGRVDSVKGSIRNSFETAPDAPVSKFVLEMQGGKKGLVVNSRNICKSVAKAKVKMESQSGKALESNPVVKNSCKKKHRQGRGSRSKSRR
jgi:hypothetical protein